VCIFISLFFGVLIIVIFYHEDHEGIEEKNFMSFLSFMVNQIRD